MSTPSTSQEQDPRGSDSSRPDASPLDLKACIEYAENMKQEGTEQFKSGDWTQALASYRSALGRLPKRVEKPKARVPLPHEKEEEEEAEERARKAEEEEVKEEVPLTKEELEVVKLRSILNANIGACHVKLGEHKDAVKSCTDALSDDPKYVKALQRRASCNESLNTWSSLGEAQEDYQTLLKVLPPDSPLRPSISRSLASVKPRLESAQKKETDEMLGKLKELGNSFLGNFGLSTDNFKFEPNGQGGYSMNFGR